MATIVNMHQAKASLSRLVESALSGEEVIIARNGEPLVRLAPVPKKRKERAPGAPDEEITELFEAPLAPEGETP
jgi:prevent-host-death family protein